MYTPEQAAEFAEKHGAVEYSRDQPDRWVIRDRQLAAMLTQNCLSKP